MFQIFASQTKPFATQVHRNLGNRDCLPSFARLESLWSSLVVLGTGTRT